MKTLVLTADANTLIYHRGDLIRDLAARGCEVVTSAAEDYPHVREFMRSLGGRHRPIRMARSTVSLTRDWQTWRDMWKLFREEKPDALFAYTIKSVCYGCVIARLAGVRRIYALLPEARSRLNTVYMVTYFLGGALGSALGAYGWSHWGWSGVCMAGTTQLVVALAVRTWMHVTRQTAPVPVAREAHVG